MAYLRGPYYLWTSSGPDHRLLHIWSKDGYDSWDHSGWAIDDRDDQEVEQWSRREGYETASGTSIPMHVMDEFVIMRLIELIREGSVDAAIDRVVSRRGPFWEKDAEHLRAVLRTVRFDGAGQH